MTSDNLSNFSTHVTTFHDLCMTLTTNRDKILMTLKTNGEDTLTTPMISGENTLMTTVTTRDYLVTTPHDVTDDPCDDMDDLEQINPLAATIVARIFASNKIQDQTPTLMTHFL